MSRAPQHQLTIPGRQTVASWPSGGSDGSSKGPIQWGQGSGLPSAGWDV